MNASYYVGWRSFRLLYKLYFRWHVYHPERVPMQGPVILAANHTSYLDPPLVAAGVPRAICILARNTLFDVPVMGRILRSWNTVPVDRDSGAAGLRAILDRLLEGRAILVFPEGARSADGCLLPARSGIGLTVIRSEAPVVPVRVFGTHAAYSRHQRFPYPKPIAVKYGFPLHFTEARTEAKSCSKKRLKELYQQIADEIMAQISHLHPCRDITIFPEH